MRRDEYLRLLAEGFDLAFQKGDLAAGAARYGAALSSLAPGEVAHSGHHGEYAAILVRLSRPEEAFAEYRRALEAAVQESGGNPECSDVALARYFLAEQLLGMGRSDEALEAVAGSAGTSTSFAGPLITLRAEALAAAGRTAEAKDAAAQAVLAATEEQRPRIRERLAPLLKGT